VNREHFPFLEYMEARRIINAIAGRIGGHA